MIDRTEVKTYLEVLLCDDCGVEMKHTNMTLTTYPAQYPHECVECGKIENKLDMYPKVVYERD